MLSPYLLVVEGKIQAGGGTSAASPLWASLFALINAKRPSGKQVGYVAPVLYRRKGGKTIGALCCNDVISGNNTTDEQGGYAARVGYDATSGWGTPDGMKLLSLLPL